MKGIVEFSFSAQAPIMALCKIGGFPFPSKTEPVSHSDYFFLVDSDYNWFIFSLCIPEKELLESKFPKQWTMNIVPFMKNFPFPTDLKPIIDSWKKVILYWIFYSFFLPQSKERKVIAQSFVSRKTCYIFLHCCSKAEILALCFENWSNEKKVFDTNFGFTCE